MGIGRVVLLLGSLKYFPQEDGAGWLTGGAFLRGLWFDNVIACYISIVPLAVLSVLGLLNVLNRKILGAAAGYYILFYLLVIGLCIANVPYFAYFFKPINSSIFNWNEEVSTNAGMLAGETSYYVYFALFAGLAGLFSLLVVRGMRRIPVPSLKNLRGKDYFVYPAVGACLIALCLFGIRGRFGYNPIRTSQAYFTNNSFINQLGVNPVFYLMRDILETSKKHYTVDKLVTEKDALALVRRELKLAGDSPPGTSPVRRAVRPEQPEDRKNVVIVLMESMSADFLQTRENGKELTPCLNQLIRESYYFPNFYSAGIHTNHGILAALYGMPSILDKNMMKNVNIPHCQGIPSILQEQGYHTMLFVSHEAQYDNINAFTLENGIETVYSQESYPKDKRVNNWGVADDYLFRYAAGVLDQESRTGKPFFATILTISNHPPYVIPKRFTHVSDNPQHQIVAFADDAIGQFMAEAKKQDWYKHTLFVFLGDHGKLTGTKNYDMPLSYNHIPLIIHGAGLGEPHVCEPFGNQVDVFPTLLGLLHVPYTNNTLGIDLLKDHRPYAFFTSDDAIGAIDSTWFYSYNIKTDREGLYRYQAGDFTNYLEAHKEKALKMRAYTSSIIRTSAYMFEHTLTRE